MDESQNHNSQKKKKKEYILYDPIYVNFLNRQY